MNKLLLLGALGILSVPATAQQKRVAVEPTEKQPYSLRVQAPPLQKAAARSGVRGLAKAAGTNLFSETFANGIPAGWSAQSLGGTTASWKWANNGTTGQYTVGDLFSTSAADGWMVYDSDSIGKLTPSLTPLIGTLTSPSYNLSTEPFVEVSFEQSFRRFQDTCYLDVSTDNFSTFTRYAIQPNNMLRNNGETDNPELTRVNISPTAGNQANVKVRFYYIGAFAGGAYNWLLDDFKINRGDQADMGINRVYHMMTLRDPNQNAMTYFGDYPQQLLDTLYAFGEASNYGSGTQSSATVGLQIQNTTTSSVVLTQSLAQSPYSLNDQFRELQTTQGAVPTATGLYTTTANVTVTGAADADATNNTDTSYFRVTDSVLSSSPYRISSGYYLSRSTSKNTAGILFDIPVGKSDTVTGFSAAFHPATNVASMGSGMLSVQIYSLDSANNQFIPRFSSVERGLTAADLSSSTQTKYVQFATNYTLGGSQADFILGPGSYLAAVQINNLPVASEVIIGSTISDAPVSKFIPGFLVASNNAGTFDFQTAAVADRSTLDNVPMVRVHFANDADAILNGTAVKNVTTNFEAEAARPNPTNAQFIVPVTLKAAVANVSVTLTNPMGQVVATQNFGKVAAGQTQNAVFNTSSLAAGVYFYTVEAGGERTTNRVVVAH